MVKFPSECAVYRMFNEVGDLLWVGQSMSVPARLANHRSEHQDWWPEVATVTVTHYTGRRAAAAAEYEALLNESPRHNVHKALFRPPFDTKAERDGEVDPAPLGEAA